MPTRSWSSMPAHRRQVHGLSRARPGARGRPRGQVDGIGTRPHSPAPEVRRSSSATCRGNGERITDRDGQTHVAGGAPRDDRLVAAGHRVVHGGREYGAPVRSMRVMAGSTAVGATSPTAQSGAIQRSRPRRGPARSLSLNRRSTGASRRWLGRPAARAVRGGRASLRVPLSYEFIASALPAGARVASGRVIMLSQWREPVRDAQGPKRRDDHGLLGSRWPRDGGARARSIRGCSCTCWASTDGRRRHRGSPLQPLRAVGLSGISSDMRAARQRRPTRSGGSRCLRHRIGRELNSLTAALGGLDALVFTAGIGDTPEIRARVPGCGLARVRSSDRREYRRGAVYLHGRVPDLILGDPDRREPDDRPAYAGRRGRSATARGLRFPSPP